MSGLHHVTAISGAAQRNLSFYSSTLGLRLVKRTVNFDDPGTWHLYYGNGAASPGSILTFFPWAHAAAGQLGSGETMETRLAVPKDALFEWRRKLPEAEMEAGRLAFIDPDGMRLALEETAPGQGSAIHKIAGVRLAVPEPQRTAEILTGIFGYKDEGGGMFTCDGGHVELVQSHAPRGKLGRGSVHHIAFRAADDAAQSSMVNELESQFGIRATEQRDRNYFRSVYFREPGGVLFEIATDGPGFAVDEPQEALGKSLKLPAFLEARRHEIEARLPPLEG